MNPILLNMLLNRQGEQANVEEMLGDNSDLDPVTRMLISQALASNNAQDDERDEIDQDEDDDYILSRRQRAIKRLRARFEKMQRQIEGMHQQIEELEAHNDTLAAGLGACYLCWGKDPECPECEGKGTPGSVTPDWALFKEWILPAIKAMQAAEPQRFKCRARSVQPQTKEEP